jgi:L-ascorbate metabolism protein UlaG (beta-lactamase superfamily)
MKVTKIGHACLLIEEGNAHILIDPGSYNPMPEVENLDAVLITHEHQDHLDVPMLKAVLEKNPKAVVVTVAEVAKKLEEEGIPSRVIEDGGMMEIAGVSVQSQGKEHAHIYGDMPKCQNTGFLIAGRLYHPGDSFHMPTAPVEILALPVGGPWMKIGEAIDYALAVKPRVVFPMHDAMFHPERSGTSRRFPQMILEPADIEFRDMNEGSVEEF